MDKIKTGDFIEMEYVGRVKNNNKIFDLTDEKLAKKEGIFNDKLEYGPIIICVGEGQLLRGLDDEIVGKEIGKKYSIELESEIAFGRKNAKLIKLISLSSFKKQKINPYPGLQVNINGMIGLVRTVSGGRVMVDFNHPLAGRDVIYEVKINKKITDTKEKLDSLIKTDLMQKEFKSNIKDKKAKIEISMKFPDEFKNKFKERVKRLLTEIKDIEFKEKKEDKANKKK